MIRTILVDDERPALDELNYLLTQNYTHDIEVIGMADTAQEALSLITKEKPDLVFLDIQMRGFTGLELADMIHNTSPKTQIIFATAYDEYALKAFELEATDYIVKPIEDDRLALAIKHVKNKLSLYQDTQQTSDKDMVTTTPDFSSHKIPVDYQGRILLINIKDIMYISSETGSVEIHTKKAIYSTNKTLTDLQDKLAKNSFYRIHRSYIVNLHEVTEVVPWFKGTYWVKVPDVDPSGHPCLATLPISKAQVKAIREYLGL